MGKIWVADGVDEFHQLLERKGTSAGCWLHAEVLLVLIDDTVMD